MNWNVFDRLRSTLADLDPEQFDYSQAFTAYQCGCVAYHLCKVTGRIGDPDHASPNDIKAQLDVTFQEARYLYGWAGFDQPHAYSRQDNRPYCGQAALTEALRRLDFVASRYQRPQPTQADREQHFLMSCRQTACQPVEPETV